MPQDLVKTIGRQEIIKSLGTSDKIEAKKQWAIENAKAEAKAKAKAEAWFADLREKRLLANDININMIY